MDDVIGSPYPILITCKRILAVEGKDEKNFFEKLLRHLKIRDCQIEELGGKDQFSSKLPVLKRALGFDDVTHLGIVRDKNGDDAFRSVTTILAKEGLATPEKRGEFAPGAPNVGVFIMPGSIDGTMLEDLCLETVKGEPAMECVEAFMECVSSLEEKPKNLSKAKAQAYLATRPQTTDMTGLAAKMGHWNFDAPCLDELKQFLKHLR